MVRFCYCLLDESALLNVLNYSRLRVRGTYVGAMKSTK